jgi:transposase
MIAADAPAAPATSSSRLEVTNGSERRIEIAFAYRRRVFFDARIDVEALSRMVEILDRR